jgi:mono/diheme cytochrome c family protein
MLDESPAQLVAYLDHPNGWWRDNAQKQLVILGDKSVVTALRQLAVGEPTKLIKKPGALARIHALWTLEGLDAMDQATISRALKDDDAQVRRTAIWLSEPYLKKNEEAMIQQVAQLQNDPSDDVRVQLLESLHYSSTDKAKAVIQELLAQNPSHPVLTAVEASIQKNGDFKTYGRKLGSLTAADRNSVLRGAEIFKSLCSSCHGTDGKGLANEVAPPIAGSKHLADNELLLKILLQGLSGPIDGKTYPTIMPSMADNNDEWIASVANYVRYEFGTPTGPPPARQPAQNAARPAGTAAGPSSVSATAGRGPGGFRRTLSIIKAEEVAKLRQETAHRTQPWLVDELEAAKPGQ